MKLYSQYEAMAGDLFLNESGIDAHNLVNGVAVVSEGADTLEDEEYTGEIEESETTVQTLQELISENGEITFYSLNEEMTEIVEEQVKLICEEENVETIMEKNPKRPLKFIFLNSAKNAKLDSLKQFGKVKAKLTKMARNSTKIDHVDFLEKDRDTTIKMLEARKSVIDNYGLAAKIEKLVKWLREDYKNLLRAKKDELVAVKNQKKKNLRESALETLYKVDSETGNITESVALIGEDDEDQIEEGEFYHSKLMALVEANLSAKVDSTVGSMKNTIARADKFKLEKIKRDLPLIAAKTAVKKQKAAKSGKTEEAKEYDRLVNYLRMGAGRDVESRLRTLKVVKESEELGITVNIPVCEEADELNIADLALTQKQIKDAISVEWQMRMLDDERERNLTAAMADKVLPNEVGGEENNGTLGFTPAPPVNISESTKEEECTGEDDCVCEACKSEKTRKKAIKEAKCK